MYSLFAVIAEWHGLRSAGTCWESVITSLSAGTRAASGFGFFVLVDAQSAGTQETNDGHRELQQVEVPFSREVYNGPSVSVLAPSPWPDPGI